MSVARWLTLIPADEAREILAETPPVGHEHVPLTAALGRVLAHAFAAPDNLPSERRSVMDGYAVRAADVHTASELLSVVLNVVGSVPMGDVFHGRMAAGEAVEIATGGFLPTDADAVVMVEQTAPLGGSGDGSGGGARIEVSRAVAAGANVVQAGEDLDPWRGCSSRGPPAARRGSRRCSPRSASSPSRSSGARGSPCCRPATSSARPRPRRAPGRCATPTSSRSPGRSRRPGAT